MARRKTARKTAKKKSTRKKKARGTTGSGTSRGGRKVARKRPAKKSASKKKAAAKRTTKKKSTRRKASGRTTGGKRAAKMSRDVEKTYSTRQTVAKLRRLADAMESGKRFNIQIAGERVYIPADATFNIEHERGEGGEEVEFQFKWSTG